MALPTTLVACAATRTGKRPRVEANQLTFALPDLEGNVVFSTDDRFAGKVLLVNLWGTWCPPCLSEIPTFKNLQNRLGPQGLVVVAIAFEKKTDAAVRRDRLRTFFLQNQINYLILDGGATSDFASALPTVTGVEGLPVEILVDREGVVVDIRNGCGYSEKWAKDQEKRLADLLVG
jgi:thiol-disulfide isomerase/thioredoxin